MKLRDLLKDIPIINVTGNLDEDISKIAYDSRKTTKGSLFVSIAGYTDDGHGYIDDAINNGATAIIIQKDVPMREGITYVKVADTRYALAAVSAEFYGHPSKKLKLIGVTGTKGKTTTTYMIKSILEKSGQKIGLIGTIANRIGDEILHAERTTPESLDLQRLFSEMVQKNVDSVVMEVSSHALELHRVSCCDFDVGIFTNLTLDHLDFHHTFENYLNAKAKLFEMTKFGIINLDNSYGRQVLAKANCPVWTFGIESNEVDIKCIDMIAQPNAVDFDFAAPWGRGSIHVNIPGKFTVYNALGAMGACAKLGSTTDEIKAGLADVRVMGRAEVVDTGTDYSVMIDYAHTPDSLENILTTIRTFAPAKVICVFGCGGDRDRTKRPIMGEISGRLADFTVVTSDNPRTEDPESIVMEIVEGVKRVTDNYVAIVDRTEAIRYAMDIARKGDIILLAGKGHETYQLFKDKVIHYDEREVVRKILQEKKERKFLKSDSFHHGFTLGG